MSTTRSLADLALRIDRAVKSGEARDLRTRADLSYGDAGHACGGVTASAVLHWERGTRRPRGRNLRAYGQFLDQLRNALADSRPAGGDSANAA